MAINIVSQPQSPYNPAYNPIVYVVNSTEKSRQGFRYIVEIKSTGAFPYVIGSLKIAPRVGDGYCYVDVSGILKNYVDKALVLDTDYDATSDTVFPYSVEFGEEFQVTAGYNTVRDNNGFLTFVRTSAPHGLTNLDVGAPIVATNGFTPYTDSRQRVNGFHTIKSIPNGFEIETTTPWSVIGTLVGPVGGTWRFADRRVSRFTNLAKATGTVVNAALGLEEYKTYIDSAISPWQNDSAAGEILTGLPLDGFEATLDQHVYLHVFNKPTTNTEWCYFTNSGGSVFRKATSGLLQIVKGVGVGPGNLGTLSLVSGSGNLIEPDTKWYTVQFRNTSGSWVSQTHKITLDRRCAINNIQILFMDRKSSWGSFAFQLRNRESVTVEKSTFRKEIPKTLTPSWVTVNRDDRGTQTFHSRAQKSWELNTNWMGDAMSLYFESLLSSPYTLINWGDGKWYACQVEDVSGFVTERYKNVKLIRKTIKISLSIEDPVQTAGTITPFQGAGFNANDGFVEPAPSDWNPRNLGVSPG
jgi:hypothetical protein